MIRQAAPTRGIGYKLLLALTFVFLLTLVFDGVLRWYLGSAGIGWLVYLPKAAVFLAFICTIVVGMYRGRVSKLVLGACIIVAMYAGVGIVYTANVEQVLFGIYTLFPLLLGLLLAPTLERLGYHLLPYLALLWVCAAAGVVFTLFENAPWQDFQYQIGATELASSRDWTTYGIQRLPGFSRASYAVAQQLIVFAIGIIWLSRRHMVTAVVWLITGALIVLTTTKRTVGLFVMFSVLLPFLRVGIVPTTLRIISWRITPWIVGIVGVALPLSTLFVHYSLNLQNPTSAVLFTSFGGRLTETWPDVFRLVTAHGSVVLGRGVGGIGAAQKFFEPNLYTFSDNVYLELYAMFGVVGIVLIFLYVKAVAKLPFDRHGISGLMWVMAVAVLMGGWAASGIEGPLTALVYGVTWSYALRHYSSRAFRFKVGLQRSRNDEAMQPLTSNLDECVEHCDVEHGSV